MAEEGKRGREETPEEKPGSFGWSGELDSREATCVHSHRTLGQTSTCGFPFFLRFKRLTDAHNNYLLMFLSSLRWISLRLEITTNLLAFAVTLFVAFGISSAPYSYKAMAISLILQVREVRGLGLRAWADPGWPWDFDDSLGFGPFVIL